MSKGKKWALIIAGTVVGLFVLFFAFRGIQASFNFNFVKWFSSWFAANGWIAIIIFVVIALIAICIGVVFGIKKASDWFETKVAEKVAEQTGKPLVTKPKRGKAKKDDSEQAAEVGPGDDSDEEDGKEAVIEQEGEPAEATEGSDPGPSPAAEAGFLNELKTFIAKGNRRIFWLISAILIMLLLLAGGFGYATYNFWQKANTFKAKADTLEKMMKACIDTNAFYNILNKQNELMIKFGIPLPKEIDAQEVRNWNVDAMFTNLYCQFRANQADVNKNYLELLPKYPQAQKCTCDIQACTEVKGDAPVLAAPAPEPEKPKAECGNNKCEKDAGENIDSCPADCKPKHFCGDGKCNSDENETSCPDDCYKAPPPPPKPICGDGKCEANENCPTDCSPEENTSPPETMKVYPGCDNQ